MTTEKHKAYNMPMKIDLRWVDERAFIVKPFKQSLWINRLLTMNWVNDFYGMTTEMFVHRLMLSGGLEYEGSLSENRLLEFLSLQPLYNILALNIRYAYCKDEAPLYTRSLNMYSKLYNATNRYFEQETEDWVQYRVILDTLLVEYLNTSNVFKIQIV